MSRPAITFLPQPQAFLMFDVPMDELPEPYAKAMEPHLEFDPQIFMLPWPLEAFPLVGTKITLMDGHGPFEEMVVADHEQVFDLRRGLRLEANCVPVGGPECREQAEALKALARHGCLLFSTYKSVKEILEDAGLSFERGR